MTREKFISEVRACQGQLRRFLASLCGDAALADDIAQEALTRAYVTSERFIGNFKAWLFRIAYNCFIDNLRRSPDGAVDIDSREAMRLGGGAASDASFEHEELRRALTLIPEKERTAIVLFYFEDLPIKEISTIMGAPAGTVKYYLSVGRNHLKEHINL
ncbi:MAG: RNA polymerase sigma factor [Bacteroidales bacterium]|jgi:RNA polymerase sigma-70 factor (ECF subfamily)|nr:RNA polymerase sigma factor [Bacteroidales bacterium]MBR3527455.1 RNA polymerase sigma factor [Bacteroidales bacterium]MCR5828019.1 RNA polymerase sigma factor [Bacteroidales bacterium]